MKNLSSLTRLDLIKIIANMHDTIQTWNSGWGLSHDDATIMTKVGSTAIKELKDNFDGDMDLSTINVNEEVVVAPALKIETKERTATFTYNGKSTNIKNIDPSTPNEFINQPWANIQQEVFDQLDDSKVFTNEELFILAEMKSDDFLVLIKDNMNSTINLSTISSKKETKEGVDSKFTIKYAESLAKENVVYGESIGNYVFGYMKAVEETRAKDMLETLEWIVKTNSSISVNGYDKAINLINNVSKIQ